jgi:hypothetical protein
MKSLTPPSSPPHHHLLPSSLQHCRIRQSHVIRASDNFLFVIFWEAVLGFELRASLDRHSTT